MSSYMSVYISFKGRDDKHLIYSVSRNHDFYQMLMESVNPAFSGNETVYTEIKEADLNRTLADIRSEARSYEKSLIEYEKYAGSNPDYIEHILSLKEQIDDLNDVYSKIDLFKDMLNEYCSDIDKMYLTVD